MQLEDIFLQAERSRKAVTREQILEWKKGVIRQESSGFLEVEEQDHTVEDCPGNDAVKCVLARQFQKMRAGKAKKVSSGAILVGEIGVGKTYLASAVAFEAGLPVVTIKNLLREYVGLSDTNQERMLSLLDAMAPLVVLVPEADVFFGKRKSEGDSGVQSRQFGRYMNFISHPKNKGRVFWILDTAHPDNLTDDIKRPGRCDLILPLFPFTEAKEILQVLRKVFDRMDIQVGETEADGIAKVIDYKLADQHGGGYTPSDLTKIAIRVEEIAEAKSHKKAVSEDVISAFSEFSAGAISEVREYQRLIAITECTEIQCISPRYQKVPMDELRSRLNELKVLLWGRV
jgi:SpoVK/Ycf46/Vps4 family AAA+-type ATPase